MNSCPSKQSTCTDFGQSTAVVTWTNPEATDNSLQFPTVTCSPKSGSEFEIGEITVTCHALDKAGNQATCTFSVQVKGNYCI